MGADIHFFVERLEDNRWVSCDEWGPVSPVPWDLDLLAPVDSFYADRDQSNNQPEVTGWQGNHCSALAVIERPSTISPH